MEVFFCDLGEEDKSVAFFPESGRFFRTNGSGKMLIDHIASGGGYDTLPSCLQMSEPEYGAYCGTVESYNERLEEQTVESCQCGKKRLDRLVIHVSNDCNLRCTYCYAAGGAYGSHRSIVSLDMVEKALDRFYGYFDEIRNLQIFGGEPLFNMPAIRFICEYTEKKFEERGVRTNIGIVTNGTLITDEFISLVKKYNINVTVSYDGNRKVNDFTRPFVGGKGSTESILTKAQKMYKETNQPTTIEVTYTQHHIEQKVDIMDVLNELHELFPKTMVHLVPVSGKKTDAFTIKNLSVFADSVDQLFDPKVNKNNLTYSLMQRIITGIANHTKGSSHICNAGVGTLSVSTKGDVYPCFMFTDEEDLKLGNIEDENLFESPRLKEKLERLHNFSDKSKNEECSHCFMRNLCNGCLGLNASHKGETFEINHDICDMYRAMAKRAIIQCVNNEVMAEVV